MTLFQKTDERDREKKKTTMNTIHKMEKSFKLKVHNFITKIFKTLKKHITTKQQYQQ